MVISIIEEMIVYFGNDVRRINHALKVYSFAHTISQLEHIPAHEALIVDLAAVLHDIGIKEAERKHHSPAGVYQELEGPPIAKEILAKKGIDTEIIERVCYLIGNHHSYQKIDPLDFQILVEADFLVNIYEDNLPAESIESIRSKYFKTESGARLLDTMYVAVKG